MENYWFNTALNDYENVMDHLHGPWSFAYHAQLLEARMLAGHQPTETDVELLSEIFGTKYFKSFSCRIKAVGYEVDPNNEPEPIESSEFPEIIDPYEASLDRISIREINGSPMVTVDMFICDNPEQPERYVAVPSGGILDLEVNLTSDVQGYLSYHVIGMRELLISRDYQNEHNPQNQRQMLCDHLDRIANDLNEQLSKGTVTLSCGMYYETRDTSPINWKNDLIDQRFIAPEERTLISGKIVGAVLPELVTGLNEPGRIRNVRSLPISHGTPHIALYEELSQQMYFAPMDMVDALTIEE